MTETIYLAAGCFWGTQWYFDQVDGVVETESGYQGGHTDNPTWESTSTHTTGHTETVRTVYDTDKISTENILRHFFAMNDPTQVNRQGPNIGDNYRSEIFYTTDEQKDIAEKLIKELQLNYNQPIATKVTKAPKFWPAEEFHQKFTERTGHGACHVSPSEVKI